MDNWLDIIPAIPLARGVPVVSRDGTMRGIVFEITDDDQVIIASRDGDMAAHDSRVDEDDPQGFGYALRDAFKVSAPMINHVPDTVQYMVNRHMYNETTDADRLALARALAEVAK